MGEIPKGSNADVTKGIDIDAVINGVSSKDGSRTVGGLDWDDIQRLNKKEADLQAERSSYEFEKELEAKQRFGQPRNSLIGEEEKTEMGKIIHGEALEEELHRARVARNRVWIDVFKHKASGQELRDRDLEVDRLEERKKAMEQKEKKEAADKDDKK